MKPAVDMAKFYSSLVANKKWELYSLFDGIKAYELEGNENALALAIKM